VADIGSGTGILSELFLENGNTVYCVEPNAGMRRAAESSLSKFRPSFISVNGSAEATNLRDSSVNLVTVGQALHWFDVEKARQEFERILRRGGYVSIVYNVRRKTGRVEGAYTRLRNKFADNEAHVPDIDNAYVEKFLNVGEYKRFVLPNSQLLDFDGILGRLKSASYMPLPESPVWTAVERGVQKIFKERDDDKTVVLHYDTMLYVGRISNPGR
jgi:SAM-dependent methyltransferase